MALPVMIRHKVILSAASPTPSVFRRYPLSYVYSGNYNNSLGTLNLQNENSGWWSTTPVDSSTAYFLIIGNSMFVHSDAKLFGLPLRSTGIRRYPLSYVFSGYYNWGTDYMGGQDSSGYWWSTTASSDSNAYNLSIHSSDLNPQYNNNKAYGFALRCVFL